MWKEEILNLSKKGKFQFNNRNRFVSSRCPFSIKIDRIYENNTRKKQQKEGYMHSLHIHAFSLDLVHFISVKKFVFINIPCIFNRIKKKCIHEHKFKK